MFHLKTGSGGEKPLLISKPIVRLRTVPISNGVSCYSFHDPL